MPTLDRITRNPDMMAGKACIRGMRVTVGTIVGLMAAGHSGIEILQAYPYLEEEDIRQSLAYAAWCVGEIEIRLPAAWGSFEADLPSLSPAQREELDNREKRYRQNPDAALPWEHVKADLLTRR